MFHFSVLRVLFLELSSVLSNEKTLVTCVFVLLEATSLSPQAAGEVFIIIATMIKLVDYIIFLMLKFL